MDELDSSGLILGFVADLLFTVRIESTAQALGYRVEWIERLEQVSPPPVNPQLAPAPARQPARQPAEHLVGPGADLIERITLQRPALIIMDLGNQAIPWREWLPLIKSAPATRRIPVICYGSHVEADTLKLARSCGAEAVLARSRFVTALPELITRYALRPDRGGIAQACSEPLHPLALRGLEAFNQGRFFEAHEELEAAWRDEPGPGRTLYQAILQVAVAYLQIERGNYNGAVKMFLRLRQWIDPLPSACRGVDVDALRHDAELARLALLALGPEEIARFDRRLFRPVTYTMPGALDDQETI